jgi:Flp pilus assembly protein TadB
MSSPQYKDDSLGAGFWLKLAGVVGAVCLVGVAIILIVGWAWYTWGLLAALVVIGGIGLGAAYVSDRRATRGAS